MATAEFSKCAGILSAALSQHHLSEFEIAQLECQIGKGVHQGCMLSPCLFNLYAEYIMQEYTEELYKKDLHDPDNHDGVITHLEADILE